MLINLDLGSIRASGSRLWASGWPVFGSDLRDGQALRLKPESLKPEAYSVSARFLSSTAAAARVGIKRATLYAYVSRGLLSAHTLAGQRGSWFDPVELDRLARRARGPAERPPDLRITSAITLIERGRYWYRGVDPEALASNHSFEAVAELLWT